MEDRSTNGIAVAFVGGEPLFEAPQGRRLYHSANYAGWKDWGGLVDFEILDQTRSMAKIKFVSDDGASKEYICVATFWDGTPLIKHEVTVKDKKAVVSFSDGHEPMYEVRSPIKGRKKWDSKGWIFCTLCDGSTGNGQGMGRLAS